MIASTPSSRSTKERAVDEVRRKLDWWWDTQLARHVVSGSGTDSATNAAWAGWQAAYAAGQREMRGRAEGLLAELFAEWGLRSYPPPKWVAEMQERIHTLPIGGTDGA